MPDQPKSRFAEAVLSQIYKNTPSARRERIIEVAHWLTRQIGSRGYDHDTILGVLRRRGLTDELIVDHVLPIATRALGEDWCSDTRSFAQVSLASARIVELIKELSCQENVTKSSAQCGALLVVHEAEQHSIGLRIVADQLRRAGYSVKFLMSASDHKIQELTASGEFSCILFSCSGEVAFPYVTQAARVARRGAGPECRFILGGFILEIEGLEIPAGVFDLITNDTHAIIDFAQIIKQNQTQTV